MSKTTVNILLLLLTMTSGCVDAISFLSLGQVFTAAMTGNTVLFGLAIAHTNGLSVTGYAVALLGFIIGAAVGATILGWSPKTPGWGPAVTVSLGVELAALILFAIITASSHTAVSGATVYLLISILSFGMGVQGVMARKIGVTGVTTTVITSTLTGLVESLVWRIGSSMLSRFNPDQAPEKLAGAASIVSMTMWIVVIVGYGVGAGICGALELRWRLQAIWLPIAIVFTVVFTATVCILRKDGERKAEISV